MERDTSAVATERYFELLRKRAPHERLAMAVSLSNAVRELASAGLRERHPNASDVELHARLASLLYGREVARRLFRDALPDDAV